MSAAVALEALRLYEEFDILGHVKLNAPILQDGLRGLAAHPLVGDVRGLGFIGGVELVRNKERKLPFDPAANIGLFAERACESRGVILRALGDTLAIAPPLVAAATDLEAILETLARALDHTLRHAKNSALL